METKTDSETETETDLETNSETETDIPNRSCGMPVFTDSSKNNLESKMKRNEVGMDELWDEF